MARILAAVDIVALIVTSILSLVAGLIGGYALQFLAAKRVKAERRSLNDLATAERCIEIFNARVEYIIAYHTRTPAERDQRQAAYHALYYGNLHALPETYVDDGTWQVWMRAERDARDKATGMKDRMQQVKEARLTVLEWLNARRKELDAKLSA